MHLLDSNLIPHMCNGQPLSQSRPDWTVNDLAAYNITICRQDAATFFGQGVLPASVPPHHPDGTDPLNKLTADETKATRLLGIWTSR